MMRKTTTTGAGMLLLILALAGCSTAANGPGESSPATEEPVPTTTPTETAAEDLEDPSTWTVSADGIGPVMIGGDFDGTLAELPTTWTSDGAACSWAAFWNAPDASYSMHFARDEDDQSEPIDEVSASTMADSVTGPVGPVTAEGLGIGSSRDDILAAYPDAEQGTGEVDGEWIAVPGATEARIFFQFLTGADLAWAVTVTEDDEPSYEVCG